jgi:hypothetical protein
MTSSRDQRKASRHRPELPGSRDYDVGFGKPPAATRFKPGQSGNPKGRPKVHKTLREEVLAALNRTITINDNGVRARITARRALGMTLVHKALKADNAALRALLSLLPEQETAQPLPKLESIRITFVNPDGTEVEKDRI